MDSPNLAQWRRIDEYKPKYGDFVIWQKIFKTSYCIVNNYDAGSEIVSLITEGTPRLLFTMTQDEIDDRVYGVRLNDMRYWKKGHFYVMQDEDGKQIWYC
jgi:hypothetical protein